MPQIERFAPKALAIKAIALAVGLVSSAVLATAPAAAEDRTLDLYYVHTGERAQITFKRNGRYDPAALKRLNVMLRDWRRNEPTRMDPALFDLVWEVYKASGARRPITVTSAYRSPTTNNMLRRRSRGVAKNSQHTYGRAMDFFIPDIPTAKLRAIALRKQHGGVGYYPTSRTPFVHLDVGSVRHWPRMNRAQLLAVFPNGRTLHVPSDGKPLPGYEQAMADYMNYKRGRGGSGGMSDSEAAAMVQYAASFSSDRDNRMRPVSGANKNLFAALFGGGADEEEDGAEVSGGASAAAAGGGDDDDAGPAIPAAAAPKATAVASAPSSLPGVAAAEPEAPAAAAPVPAAPATATIAPPAPLPAPEAVPTPAETAPAAQPEALVAAVAAPPRKPADAPEPTAAEIATSTLLASVRVPMRAPDRPDSTLLIASAMPPAKPPELVARAIIGNAPPPVLGYAADGALPPQPGAPVDVLAETARTVMRGSVASQATARSGSRSMALASASGNELDDDMPIGASGLGLVPASLTAAADEDPFADQLQAPERSDPRLLSADVTVRMMVFCDLVAPNARMMPALIAGVDLPGDDRLDDRAATGPQSDRFGNPAGDVMMTASLR